MATQAARQLTRVTLEITGDDVTDDQLRALVSHFKSSYDGLAFATARIALGLQPACPDDSYECMRSVAAARDFCASVISQRFGGNIPIATSTGPTT